VVQCVLQCVAVCCSELQSVEVCCSMVQRGRVPESWIAVHCVLIVVQCVSLCVAEC